ncbi:cobyric acid synthase [Thermodesulfobacteriota bacterium]
MSEKFRHGGNYWQYAKKSGKNLEDILDFSANINPLGPPKWLRAIISSKIDLLTNYPDPDCSELTEKIAGKFSVEPNEIIVGNGSTEILYMLPRALKAKRALIVVPSYIDYEKAVNLAGMPVERFSLYDTNDFMLDLDSLASQLKGDELVFIGRPDNPIGSVVDAGALRELAHNKADTTFVVDEAFIDFVEGADSLIQDRPKNVIVLRSFTKIFAIPGLRLGCAVADAEVISALKKIQPPWSVNTLSQYVGAECLDDDEYVKNTQEYVRLEREALQKRISSISGLKVFDASANYLLVRIDKDGIGAKDLYDNMMKKGIAIRVCDNYDGLDGRFFRVAVKRSDENEKLVVALGEEFSVTSTASTKSKTISVMFQGTSSNAGKSVLTAAMCRILFQDGYSVAPFKAQNMSLNSYVTLDGKEMGRAQVVQAMACRMEPDVRMNPLLLKPSSDTGSQVILWGEPVANMSVKEYYKYKGEAFLKVKEAYDSLASEHDVIVLEGAGSPAEINLKRHDIVNMRMAQHASAPVFITGDIDLGGIFAAFVGTMELLEEWERKLVAGFIINRFRGDASLLKDALDYTKIHTNRSVIGVVPFIRDLGLPEEDSVEFKSGALDKERASDDCVEIAVIDLPHISNFTDFDALRGEPDVNIKIVRNISDLKRPDVIILPGSKNVIGDLKYLKERGFDEKIAELNKKGVETVGICGGFQILGDTINDPHNVESHEKKIDGLGLLPLSTTLDVKKTLVRVDAEHVDSGHKVHGYEIHHGRTDVRGATHLLRMADGSFAGATLKDERVWGTYMHGIFDADDFRRWFIDEHRARKGLSKIGKVVNVYDIDAALDRLADIVRKSLPIETIYKIMGLK